MKLVESKILENVLYLMFVGRVDSTTAQQVENECYEVISNSTFSDIVIDAEKLEYISSAGLRVILKLKKDYPTVKIINASVDTYEIFEMTGFTDMMTIEKAYRKISVEGCEVIGQGANGKVYRINDDTIVKLYMNPDSLQDIKHERELARKAFVLGLPTAIPYDVVKCGESYGSVFEMLNAKSFAKILSAEPERLDEIVDKYVELLKKIHSISVKDDSLPNDKNKLLVWIDFDKAYLPKEVGEKLDRLASELKDADTMIHGDYHLKNVMLQNGETLLIDMDTLCKGNPILEFATIYSAYLGFSAVDPSISLDFLGVPHDLCVQVWKKTLQGYFGTTDESKLQEIEDKAALISFIKIFRRCIRKANNTAGASELKEYALQQIITLAQKVETLNI